MTPTELHSIVTEALSIVDLPSWDAPEISEGQDSLDFLPSEVDGEESTWALVCNEGTESDYLPVDVVLAEQLIRIHLRDWLLARGWQVCVTIRKGKQEWRLADCLSYADGGGDRLDENYPCGEDELSVLCESAVVVNRARLSS